MRRLHCFFLCLIFGVTGVVTNAQSRASDGVAAVLRGDYQQAAAILQPIVVDRNQRDSAAAFFLATLYETGRGVPLDPIRACALYQQASMDQTSVYSPTAQHLQRRLWMVHGNDWLQECQLVANIGIDHRFQPKTFTLEASHSVEWTVAAVTITYQNRTARRPLGMMYPRGVVFLPVQQTEVRVPSSPVPVHFFESFWWEPSDNQWTLRAQLFEVYRDELVHVNVSGPLITVTAADPPPLTRSELRTMMNVGVNAQGAIELRVSGAPPRTLPRR